MGKRYIDADKLREVMERYDDYAVDIVDDAPTVDAVEVVRCKDCKHRDAETGFCEGRGFPMQLVPDDGFCDKGERREDERTV